MVSANAPVPTPPEAPPQAASYTARRTRTPRMDHALKRRFPRSPYAARLRQESVVGHRPGKRDR
jgi:hypothetical protein